MSIISRMQQKIETGQYHLTRHADVEARDDGLSIFDTKSVIRTGYVVQKYTRDARGVRYKVRGFTEDGRQACVVCRFISGQLRIITVFTENRGE